MSNDEIMIYSLSSVRTCTVRGEPETVIMAVTAGDDTRHYSMNISDFLNLTKQMQADAHILAQPAQQPTVGC